MLLRPFRTAPARTKHLIYDGEHSNQSERTKHPLYDRITPTSQRPRSTSSTTVKIQPISAHEAPSLRRKFANQSERRHVRATRRLHSTDMPSSKSGQLHDAPRGRNKQQEGHAALSSSLSFRALHYSGTRQVARQGGGSSPPNTSAHVMPSPGNSIQRSSCFLRGWVVFSQTDRSNRRRSLQRLFSFAA